MARQTEGINGGFCGRVGTVIGYQWRGKWCMRSYPRKIHDRRSEAQLAQRDWFRRAVQFASRMTEALRVGLREVSRAQGMTEGNLFIALNKGLFSVAEGRLRVDFGRVMLADGPVAPVAFGEVELIGTEGARAVRVSFGRNPLHLPCDTADRVYLVAVCTEGLEGELSLPAYRRNGTLTFGLPARWEGREVHLYGMVQNYEGAASPSVYLGSVRLEDASVEPLLDGSADLGGQGGELVGGHLDMVPEVEVAGAVERHEVDVDVGHIDAHHGLADFDAGAHLLEAASHPLGKEVQLGEEGVVEVEDVVDFLLGNAEHMAAHNGVDVEESQAVLGLEDLVAGDFACHNL